MTFLLFLLLCHLLFSDVSLAETRHVGVTSERAALPDRAHAALVSVLPMKSHSHNDESQVGMQTPNLA